MESARASVRILAATAALFAAACQDATPPTDPAAVAIANAPPQAPQAPDAALLARTLPGFGGFFYDAGVPTVYLTDPGQRAAAAAALGRAASEIQVRQGRFTYQQLDRWFQATSLEALAHAGVVFVDLDEAANRVTVGVEGPAAGGLVRALVARLGMPAEAIIVREVEPIGFATTLRDRVRPVVAGVQIRFSNFLCSLGFNAVRGGQNSFVTASHCTDHQGGTEGTLYYQPLNQVADEFIGTEVDDPRYFRNQNGCPHGRKCRFSDAARAAYASGVTFTLGGIAQTSGPNNGSLTITGGFKINSEGTAAVGDVANKVGRTTGWTQGTVTNTCVNTGVSGTNIVLLCQTFVSAGVQIVGAGDSGSDVFGLAGSNASLFGILWGGNSSGTLFVYSPITNVERELGALTTF